MSGPPPNRVGAAYPQPTAHARSHAPCESPRVLQATISGIQPAPLAHGPHLR
jgi:hypothetical protein